MNYLNLGCGHRWHPEWTNVDYVSTHPEVIPYDLTQGIPFPDVSFDVVYHSHILEHLPKSKSNLFLKECYRVLRPKGILRVAVPDLERIARLYLEALERALAGSQGWAAAYEWILLEMYDQTVRNHPGGEMAAYLLQENIPNEEFVVERCGVDMRGFIEAGRRRRQAASLSPNGVDRPGSEGKAGHWGHRVTSRIRESVLKRLLGEEYRALQTGRFRQGGEIHQWMYDRYSLSILLERSGFEKILEKTARESDIPEWASFHLDVTPDGIIYKPDSLFMEATKSVR